MRRKPSPPVPSGPGRVRCLDLTTHNNPITSPPYPPSWCRRLVPPAATTPQLCRNYPGRAPDGPLATKVTFCSGFFRISNDISSKNRSFPDTVLPRLQRNSKARTRDKMLQIHWYFSIGNDLRHFRKLRTTHKNKVGKGPT